MIELPNHKILSKYSRKMSLTHTIVSIEGNIGTGKSTLIQRLKQVCSNNPTILFLQEPVHEWMNTKDENGVNILDSFYHDMPRWSFTFQLNAFITRIHAIRDCLQSATQPMVLIMERSVFTDRTIFASQLRQQGKMNLTEWTLYTKWFDWLTTEYKQWMPTHYIYLRASPTVSFERMRTRGRLEEADIPFEYIDTIHKAHETWLMEHTSCKVVEYDTTNSDETERRFQDIYGFVRRMV